MSDIIKKTKVKLHAIHGNVEINDSSARESDIKKENHKKRAQMDNSKPYKQLQQVPYIRSRLTEKITKDGSGETEVEESEITFKRYNKLKAKEEHQRFPMYQFHKYYHIE